MKHSSLFSLWGHQPGREDTKAWKQNFIKVLAVPWFSTSLEEQHVMDTIDICVRLCNVIPCFDIVIRAAAAEWK